MKEHYLRSVRNLLDCSPKERRRLLAQLDKAINTYLEDFPKASESDIITNFGTPENCATRLLSECSSIDILAERKKEIRRYNVLIIVLVILIAAVTCFTVHNYHRYGGFAIVHTGKGAPDRNEPMVTYHYKD